MKQSKKSAILLVEFQNQWTKEGLHHKLIKKQLIKRKVLENTKKIVESARKKGIKIIHAPLIIDPKNKRGLFAYLTFGKFFTKGKSRSEITEGLLKKEDIVIKGRYAFDAFIGSDLEEVLNKNKFDKIFVCGFITDQCVTKTLRTMNKKGFKGYLVSDCTATLNSFFQKKTEKEFKKKIINSFEITADSVGK